MNSGDPNQAARQRSSGREPVTILELGAEGGSVSLLGRVAKRSWHYRVACYDCSALFLDEDEDLYPTTWFTPWLHSLRAAMKALDRYGWPNLSPQFVAPEFRRQVRASLRRRLQPSSARQWRNWNRAFESAADPKLAQGVSL